MGVLREKRSRQFNFLVDLGTGSTGSPDGGFQEMSSIRKLTGLRKSGQVTLKRGVVSSAALREWLNGAPRDVSIREQNEDRTAAAQRWKLMRARIVKHTSGPLNAKGADVAIEELVLSYERLELE